MELITLTTSNGPFSLAGLFLSAQLARATIQCYQQCMVSLLDLDRTGGFVAASLGDSLSDKHQIASP